MCLFGRNRPYRFEQLPAGEQQKYADVHRFMLGWYAKYENEKYVKLEYPRDMFYRRYCWDLYRARYLIEGKMKWRLQEYVKELGVPMHNVMSYVSWNEFASITIFYNTEQEVKMYEESGVSEKIRERAMKILEDVGIYEYFPHTYTLHPYPPRPSMTISFSSWEYVQRFCKGSYKIWLIHQ